MAARVGPGMDRRLGFGERLRAGHRFRRLWLDLQSVTALVGSVDLARDR